MKPFYLSSETVLPIKPVLPFKRNLYRYVKGPNKQWPTVGVCRVYGLWFMVYGLWFMVYGLWFMVYGLWFMVYGLWFMVYGLGSRV
jgi:hypothetical protein